MLLFEEWEETKNRFSGEDRLHIGPGTWDTAWTTHEPLEEVLPRPGSRHPLGPTHARYSDYIEKIISHQPTSIRGPWSTEIKDSFSGE